MRIATYLDAPAVVVERSDGRGVVRNYFGAAMNMKEGPQAFLAEMEPGSRLPSHFHDIDQFQVFVKGSGRIGGAHWRAGTFHYADAYTPYGPLIPNPGSEMFFFSLRNAASGGLFVMPESRQLIDGRRGRNLVSQFALPDRETNEQQADENHALLELKEDGGKGEGIHLAPGENIPMDSPHEGGQYILVLAGSLVHEGQPLPPLTLIFVDSGERVSDLVSGPAGADVLRMQFPRPSKRSGSDPKQLATRGTSDRGQAPISHNPPVKT